MKFKKIELDYKNLPKTLMVNLDDDFRKQLFSDLKSRFENIEELCKYLRCSVSSLKYYNRGEYFIPTAIFQRAISICKFKDEKVNSSILQAKKRLCGKPINVKLPINSSTELSALIGHTMGDGHISSVGRFVYVNKEILLIEKVKNLINRVFRSKVYFDQRPKKDGSVSLHYPSAIGEMLFVLGSIKGNKTYQEWAIPSWIEYGSSKIKSDFLKAIFDDEGSVSKTRLSLSMSKIETKKDSLIKLLESFKRLLHDLDIKSSKTGVGYKRTSKKGIKTTNFVFVICEYYNMKKFYENVGFTHNKKSKRLKELLDSYIRPIGKTRKDILDLLKNKTLSTHEIRVSLNKSKKCIQYNLWILEDRGEIERIRINKIKHLWKKK